MFPKTYLFLFSLMLFLISTSFLVAQSEEEAVDMSDVYTIESPSSKFKSIHLQSHKGLPRFGAQNLYYIKNKAGTFKGVNRAKNELLKQGYTNYYKLLEMKQLHSYFDDIDREYLTVVTRENSGNRKDVNSSIAQKILLPLAYGIGSDEQIRTYFCDPKDPNCRFKRNWGGSRDDFEMQEKYATYVKENLNDLRTWSKTLFEGDRQTGYLVHKYEFSPYGKPVLSYDFDQNGFWIDVLPSNRNRHSRGFQFLRDESFFFEFLPETSYGNAHLNRMTDTNSYWPKMLLKMNPSDAEALVNRNPKSIYAVIKVTVVLKGVEEPQVSIPYIKYTYHLADSLIEFYEDVELTQKFGQISLENPIYQK